MLFLRFVNRLMSEIIMPISIWYNLSKALDFGLLCTGKFICRLLKVYFLHFRQLLHIYMPKKQYLCISKLKKSTTYLKLNY